MVFVKGKVDFCDGKVHINGHPTIIRAKSHLAAYSLGIDHECYDANTIMYGDIYEEDGEFFYDGDDRRRSKAKMAIVPGATEEEFVSFDDFGQCSPVGIEYDTLMVCAKKFAIKKNNGYFLYSAYGADRSVC